MSFNSKVIVRTQRHRHTQTDTHLGPTVLLDHQSVRLTLDVRITWGWSGRTAHAFCSEVAVHLVQSPTIHLYVCRWWSQTTKQVRDDGGLRSAGHSSSSTIKPSPNMQVTCRVWMPPAPQLPWRRLQVPHRPAASVNLVNYIIAYIRFKQTNISIVFTQVLYSHL